MLKFKNGLLMGCRIEDPAPPAGAPPAEKPWYEGAAAEDLGYLQNRGFDKMTAKDAAFAASKAHREAEKLIGAPADKIVRLPTDANDVEGWRQVQRKLGAPADEKGYDLSVVKHADGSALSPEETASWSKRALSLGLKPSDALTLVNDIVKERDGTAAKSATEAAAALAVEKTKLAENWGPKADVNLFVAKQTAAKLGVTPEQVAAAEKTVGYAALMEMFRSIGEKIGEDRFVANPQGGGAGGAMSKDQAQDRLTTLKNDKVWVTSYMNGDAEKKKEMAALIAMGAR